MKFWAVFALCLAAAQAFAIPATTLVRAPAHDSAIVHSDRLGGNFAYSVQEGHAYAAISPIVQHVPTPVAVSHHVTAPAVPYHAPLAYQYPLSAIPSYALPVEHRLDNSLTVKSYKAAPLVY